MKIILALLIFITITAQAEISFGNFNGSIILVEYFDYNCPVCRHYVAVINSLAKNNPELKIMQRVVPLLAPTSVLVDSAVLASYLQNKFPEMQWAVLQVKNTEIIAPEEITSIAKQLGINMEKLENDMNSNVVRKQLLDNLENYRALNQTKIPIVVIYAAQNPQKDKKIFIGAYPTGVLQNTINKLKGGT